MRTTVQLRDDQRERLAVIAAQRGLRGYSALIQEAVDQYLDKPDPDRQRRIDAALALRGSLSDEQGEELRRIVRQNREAPWRTFS